MPTGTATCISKKPHHVVLPGPCPVACADCPTGKNFYGVKGEKEKSGDMITPTITVQTSITEAADTARWFGGPGAVSVGVGDPFSR